MKYFIFSDVHGYYTELRQSLKEKGFDENNSEHIIISCGDNFARGKENYKMILFLNKLRLMNRAILIKGNLEFDLERIMNRGYIISSDRAPALGMVENLRNRLNLKNSQEVIFWMLGDLQEIFQNMKWYYELGDFIFVHSGIPKEYRTAPDSKWKEASIIDFTKEYENQEIIKNKRIVNGHRFSWIYHQKFSSMPILFDAYRKIPKHFFHPFYGKGLIAIDGCTFYTKHVNILVIEETENVYKLNEFLSD